MKFTRSQKIYAAVLGLGLCALVWDRSSGNAPSLARATAVPDTDLEHHTETPAGVMGPVSFENVADKLQKLQPTLTGFPEVRDAFTPSSQWIASAEDNSKPSERAIKFQNVHRLRAIIESSGPGQVIIDDSLVSVGQSLDGFRLSSIGPLQAIFIDHDARVVLQLDSGSPIQRIPRETNP